MEEIGMDLRTKTVIASFIALIGFLAMAAYASLHQAETSPIFHAAIFGH
jgi:hypothetical protein